MVTLQVWWPQGGRGAPGLWASGTRAGTFTLPTAEPAPAPSEVCFILSFFAFQLISFVPLSFFFFFLTKYKRHIHGFDYLLKDNELNSKYYSSCRSYTYILSLY